MGNYLDKLKDLDDRTIKSFISVLKTQIRILGTEVIVESYDQTGEHRKAFGKMFQTDDFQVAPRSVSTERVIINKNFLIDHHAKQNQPIAIYHTKNILKSGDVLTFRQNDMRYRYKVYEKATYGLYPSVIFKYELVGLTEDTDVLKVRNTEY